MSVFLVHSLAKVPSFRSSNFRVYKSQCFLFFLSQKFDFFLKLLQDQYTGQRRVYQLTFTLLKLMARQNKIVQGRLFDRLDVLLSKEGASAELAECLTEVKKGGVTNSFFFKDYCWLVARFILELIMNWIYYSVILLLPLVTLI